MMLLGAVTSLSAREAILALMVSSGANAASLNDVFCLAYAPLIVATLGTRSEVQQESATEEKDWIHAKERPLLVDIRGRLTTIITAVKATDNAATALLIAAGKIAAVSSRLDARRPGAKRLRHYLGPLFSAMKIAKDVVRNKGGVTTEALQANALDLIKAHVNACRKGLLQAAPLQGQQGSWPRELRFTNQDLRWKAAAFQHTLSRYRQLPDSTTDPGPSHADLSNSDSVVITVTSSHSTNVDNPSVVASASPSCDSGRSPSKSDLSGSSSPPTLAPSSSTSSPDSSCTGKVHMPTRVPVSPGAAFVPYRRPSQLAHPRGTSLRGTGAVVRVEVKV